ncbi:ABC transporter permease [Candidatus Pacearchaeota archaeon]|nr:ABC transporter permease [Candidatus Pacearchaeota archaeon]
MKEANLLKSAFFRYGLLLPVFLYLGYIFVYPLISMFSTSFFDPNFTLEHYIRIIQKPVYLKVIFLTFRLSLICTVTSLILGYPIAYLLNHVKPNVRNILLIFVVLPFWTSILVRMYAWMVILGRNGIINSTFLKLGLISTPLDLLYNTFSVTVGMIHFLLPFMIFPLYSVMTGIDKNTVRAAYILGANPFTAFLKVFLPLSLPGVGAGSLIVFILSIGFFITPALLGGRKDVVISMVIENQVNIQFNWPFAAALALVLLVLTLILFNFSNKFLGIDRIWGGKS